MFNLIETQQALKGLPLNDVMKYANGNNPEVPSYLALSELQRRKQLEDTASAFTGQQPTVKEQIESGLTSLPQGQVNPTAEPTGMVNPTALPPQLAPTPVAPNKAMMTAAPAGMQPNAAPPVPRMAEGGLSQLPLPYMFRQSSYADGGIVHFATGTEDKTVEQMQKEQLASDRESFLDSLNRAGAAAKDIVTLPGRAVAGVLNTGIRGARAVTGADIPYIFGKDPNYTESMTPFYDKIRAADEAKAKLAAKPVQKADPDVYDREDAAAGAANKVNPTKTPANPNKQASNTSSALLNPSDNSGAPSATAQPILGGEFKSQFDAS